MNEAQLKTLATAMAKEDQCSELYDALCAALWSMMDSGCKDTLRALVTLGPVYDGDVPSKSSRDLIIELGLASKCAVRGSQGYQVANYRGCNVYAASGESAK